MDNIINIKDFKPDNSKSTVMLDTFALKLVIAIDYLHKNHDSLFGTKVIDGWYGVLYYQGEVEDLYLVPPLGKNGEWYKRDFSNDVSAMMDLMRRFIFNTQTMFTTFVIREPYKKGEIINHFDIKLRTYFRFYIKNIKSFCKTFYINPDSSTTGAYKKLNEFPGIDSYDRFTDLFKESTKDITSLNYPMKDYVKIVCDTYNFTPHNMKVLKLTNPKIS